MSARYQPCAAIAPSRTDNAYIFALVPTIENGLAAITSESELLLVNRENLSSSQVVRIHGAPSGTNCLALGDAQGSSVLCSGTGGTVTAFDLRSQNKAFEFKIDRAVTALAVNGTSIAIGTEFKSNQAIVSLWDARQTRMIWQNAENNDEITAIEFHPSRSNVVLAGGDDGLVSLFDTQVVEEEDSLLQVINHGPIHKAGFLGDDRVYALSSDQNLAVHPVSTPGDEEDPQPTLFGDLRSVIPCQYVVDVFRSGHDYVVAAGTNIDKSCVDFVKLSDATTSLTEPSLDVASKFTIEPAHGEEVVRAVVVEYGSDVIYTAGEDGYIRASRMSGRIDLTKPLKSSTKAKRGLDGRYKPY